MRLIDADAITYELWTTEVDSNRDNYRYFQNRYMVDRRDIESMPTVQRWIPCSERLPNEDGYYLVTRKNPKGHVTRARFNPEQVERGTYNSPWGNGDCDILAWMELPQPYRGDEK